MNRLSPRLLCLFATLGVLSAAAADDDNVVFRSDVSLVRVDVQVLDRNNRAVTGLRAEDFVLRDQGRVQAIKQFANENMPVDVLLLFDVSASMGPHVRRIATAANTALDVLGEKDRVGIMVFDRSTRVRLPLNANRSEVERALDRMLRDEHFSGGTDITRAMLDAADYVGSHGRRDARRAIVILTDDQTEFDRDEERVGRALIRADAVMMALIAPDAMASRGYGRGGGYPGGGYPGGGGRGGIILGVPGVGMGGPRYPRNGGTYGAPRTKSAGTSEIARDSGGDSLPVEDAAALETTLSRIRQRYALYFTVPSGARSGQERMIDVSLADRTRNRYYDADLRYRKTYVAPAGAPESGPTDAAVTNSGSAPPAVIDTDSGVPRRRRAVSEPDGRGLGPGSSAPAAAAADDSASSSDSSATPRLRRAPGADSETDSDRPVLRRSSPSTSESSSSDPDRPVMKRAPAATDSSTSSSNCTSANDKSTDKSSDSSNRDPDRPVLKRADGSSSTSTPTSTCDTSKPADSNTQANPGGWRRVKPGEQPE
ncbi:MAG: VWA domain-containing protein [Acidobacteriaceae bacterium]|nr:VWA domain-containing protein [Acidobacteriaceae bacterium]